MPLICHADTMMHTPLDSRRQRYALLLLPMLLPVFRAAITAILIITCY